MLDSGAPMPSYPSTEKVNPCIKTEHSVPLTKTELFVLNTMALDYTTEEMAAKMGMPMGALKTCIQSIFHKLAVDNRLDAIREAVARSIIELPQDQSARWSVLQRGA